MSHSKSGKKLKLEDITYYSNKRQHPFSYSKSPIAKTNKNFHQCPSTSAIFSTAVTSPLNAHCCDKNRGIMKQAIAERIEYYKKDYKKRYLRRTIQQLKQESKQKQLKELRQTPILTQQSQRIYKKIAQRRNLSPKVLVRFDQYEKSKTLHKLKLKIETYYKETRKIPKPQQIISPQKLGQLQQAKKLIDTLNDNIQKFILRSKNKQNQQQELQ